MPYINSQDGRRQLLQIGEPAQSAGELNYQIFYFVKHSQLLFDDSKIKWFVDQFLGERPNYQRYNDMTGALVRCYAEIKRRLKIEADILLIILESYNEQINKYEDTKIIQNGDVE